MAVIELPSERYQAADPVLHDGLVMQRYDEGNIVSMVQVHHPFWTMDVQIGPEHLSMEWRVWRTKMGTGQNRVECTPGWLEYPQTYGDGILPSDYDGGVATLDSATDITVSGAPTGYRIIPGDWIVVWQVSNDRRFLTQAMATSIAAGGQMNLSVLPAVPLGQFASTVRVSFANKKPLWALRPNSFSTGENIVTQAATFQLISTVRP